MLNKEDEVLRFILGILSHLLPFLVYAYMCIKCKHIYRIYLYIILLIYFNKHTLLV